MIKAKKFKIRKSHLLLLISLTLPATANTLSVEDVASKLALETTLPIRGEFTQQKYFKILSSPFVSKGKFAVSSEGVEWHTLLPVPQSLVYQNGEVRISSTSGSTTPMPQAAPFAALIRQLLVGDFAQLSKSFRFSQQSGECVDLTPLNEAILSLFRNFTVCGEGQISKITMTDSSGDQTVIHLHPQK